MTDDHQNRRQTKVSEMQQNNASIIATSGPSNPSGKVSKRDRKNSSLDRRDGLINLIAGGVGGTMGSVVTCPLEVLKVRLQSSTSSSTGSNSGHGGNGGGGGGIPVRLSPVFSHYGRPSTMTATAGKSIQMWPQGPTASVTSALSHHHSSAGPIDSNRYVHSLASSNASKTVTFASRNQQLSPINFNKLLPSSSGGGGRYSSTSIAISVATTQRGEISVIQQLKKIVAKEGLLSLWKGVLPNMIGVAPSKAVYFCAYSTSKRFLNDRYVPDTPYIHTVSSASAGFLTASVVNPIWLVKTRLQLDRKPGKDAMSIRSCVTKVFRNEGAAGFYKGVTASYFGISETVVQFVIYEYLRGICVGYDSSRQHKQNVGSGDSKLMKKLNKRDFFSYMLCGACSKFIATTALYPHEVVRTRLREEGNRYNGFLNTLSRVYREEGVARLYRGLNVHLLRTIPNTAITLGTYELVVYLLRKRFA